MTTTEADPAAEPRAPGDYAGVWDQYAWWSDPYTQWGIKTWPPGASWKDNWRWWYQYYNATQPAYDLTDKVVEARWTTDSYTLGDGTFRGDLQPGRLELRLWDGDNQLRGLSKRGQIWATFAPTGATWSWYIDSQAIRLLSPGDPGSNDVVISANTWPYQLTTGAYNASRPAESVNSRLTWAVNTIAADSGLLLAPITASIAADAHTVPATVQTSGLWPPWLQIMRDAAANGVLWVESVPGASDGSTPGSWVIHYDLWEAVRVRTLDPAQVIAGTVWNQGNGDIYTQVLWAGTDASGVQTSTSTLSGGYGPYGVFPVGPMRLWGNIAAGGAQLAASQSTATAIMNQYTPTVPYVDTVSMISGDRNKPLGAPGPAWDPAAMVYLPNDRMDWARVAGQPAESYRVQSTAHVLNVRSWSIVHTLARYVAPTHLP